MRKKISLNAQATETASYLGKKLYEPEILLKRSTIKGFWIGLSMQKTVKF